MKRAILNNLGWDNANVEAGSGVMVCLCIKLLVLLYRVRLFHMTGLYKMITGISHEGGSVVVDMVWLLMVGRGEGEEGNQRAGDVIRQSWAENYLNKLDQY